ncbi:LuxR C-terminal-related transcriptional regulator [Gordonia sp. SL306]|uniref:LuxR C-terminal-related transcriptional regulator n=1 Tax=Gordonia sp. SL306 TaxID=2995145 RepID=UPI00226FAB4B|nr:LuxR C-terminal-related transcriptional regulator [Gordonia sp. SL306]WAC57403.1 LuxR C-terminal-related transcriptional regulator [Gordonia sp. SL306]
MNESIGHLAPGARLRISRPDLPPGHVRLRRIDRALTTCRPGQVAVVSAGPGYGKTLAVAAWSRHIATEPVAWLAADESDGLRSFWGGVVGALSAAGAFRDGTAVTDVVPGVGFDRSEVELVIDGLAATETPVTLVVDDLHRIADQAVLESVRYLISRQPAQLRLILITRAASELRLQKLRLTDRLTEIGSDQLAFTHADAFEFCTRAGAELSEEDLDTLLVRTQGWPAGLRLALLSTRDADIHDALAQFGGRNETVAAYLVEEVLENLAPTDRKFLLSSSIVEMMTGELARALTGRIDSRHVLDSLVEDNLLTVRLSDRPDWYAYHPLFRELLLDRLAAENPDAPADLHRRAAAWFAESGDPISAIRHYGLAHAWAEVAEVLCRIALPLVLSTQAPALAAALAPTAAQADRRPTADTLIVASMLAYHRSDYGTMIRDADDATNALRGRPTPPAATQIVLALTRMVHARLSSLDDVVDRCDEVLGLVAGVSRSEVPAAQAYALIARNNRAIGLFHRGEIDLATKELESSRISADGAGLSLMAMAADTYLALADLADGALPEVRARTTAIRSLAERRGWTRQPQAMALYAASALTHLESHELEEAERAIAMGRSAVELGTDSGAWLILEVSAVWLAVVRGDLYAARTASKRLEAVREQAGRLPSLLSTWYQVTSAEVQILAGEADAVIARLRDPARADSYAGALTRVTLARAYLSADRPGDAADLLGATSTFAPHRLQAVEAAVLSAVASARLQRESVALERIGDATRLAAPIGHIRPFVTAGPPVRALLDRHQHLADDNAGFIRRLIAACGGTAGPVDGAPVGVLTERELVVLRYLPTMYKASEIAADLFVSVNTVKTHQQSIYRKLGVSTRREAVDRARERDLI